MVQINSRSKSANCSIGAVIDNAEGAKINVSISWDYTTTAPLRMSVNGWFSSPQGTFSTNFNFTYTADGERMSSDPAPEALDETFASALKSLVLECFEKYDNVNGIE